MSSIRSNWICRRVGCGLGVAIAASVMAGCSTQPKPVPEPVNQVPIVGDDALALRSDWPQSVAKYQNGSVVAWSTRFPYETQVNAGETQNLVLEPALFLAQVAAMPIELIANPPGMPVVYYGAEVPPSYTAQPPLPPPGGMRVARVLPYSVVGPQAPGTDLAAPPPTGPQVPTAPPISVPIAPSPLPPPGAPGGVLGPPGR